MFRVGVVVFPGSNCDDDARHVLANVVDMDAISCWHKDPLPRGLDAVVLPGGFSFGDYLRCGAIAKFSKVMEGVRRFADAGGPVLGICNGFQILTEVGLLPGALTVNESLRFVCGDVLVEVGGRETPFTRAQAGAQLVMPVAHGEGRFQADPRTLERLDAEEQIVFRYAAGHNPNGAVADVAGICNERGNVVGLMPHPERSSEPILSPEGRGDGRLLFETLRSSLEMVARRP
ncbi:MAG TPA: phosphoribosylformylglycinamidine synthase subunit PurQ [Myxococcota bacterium]|jgi:phosphoribosylformylglycinamidine synthase|nr:phosphoribosylformylglycinamidine synthase subunit PurQ [Myxococcota bacterium]